MHLAKSLIVALLTASSVSGAAWAEEYETPGELLQALEKADEGIRNLRADVRYEKIFRLQGDRHLREGELLFHVDETGRRSFAVSFEYLVAGAGGSAVRHDIDEQLVFDGRYLVDKNEREKRFIRRELAPPGEEIDPLRLGEGPIVIPIGQEREEIERRFEVELLEATSGIDARYAPLVENTYQLRLVPRESFADEIEFNEVRLWYRKSDLLPRLAHTESGSGEEAWVGLANVRVNDPGFDESAMSVELPPDGEGWEVQEIDRRAGKGG